MNTQNKFLEKSPCANNDVEVLYFNEGCELTLNENVSTPVDCDMNAKGGTSFQVVLSNLSEKLQYYHGEKPERTSYVIMLTDGCDMGDCKDYNAIFGSMNSVEFAVGEHNRLWICLRVKFGPLRFFLLLLHLNQLLLLCLRNRHLL